MVPLIDVALERYTAEHTTPPVELLAELAVVTREKMAAFNMQVGPVEGAFLRMLVALSGSKRVLEIGTFTGYSALSMAQALPEGGQLVTCDIDEEVVGIARSFFARSPHGAKIDVRLGDAKATIATLAGQSFDLVFLDADKAAYSDYYELTLPLLAKGGLLVADNALWSGRVLSPVSDDDRGVDAFNRRVNADPRVENVLLSVRDGIMLARKL